LAKINEICGIPLILHGASDWENGRVGEAVKRGVTCFNVDTAIRLAFISNLINAIHDHGNVVFDIRKILGGAREAVKNAVKKRIKFFGSEDKA